MLRRIFRRLLRTSSHVHADVDDELASFLDSRTDALIASGMAPADARAEAIRRLGGASLTAARQQLHQSATQREKHMRLREGLHQLRQDVRFALRQLAKAPGLTAVGVFTLALGIGASTAIFSAVKPVLFEPLPNPAADRVVMVWDENINFAGREVSYGSFLESTERGRSFVATAVMRSWQPTMTGPAEPERLDGQMVSASYFRVLGVPPALGRDFEAIDDRVNGPQVVMLSHGLWQRRFAADLSIIGRPITLDGDSYTVIGVMPRDFEDVLLPAADAWTPLQYDMTLPQAWGSHLRMVGRLKADVRAVDADNALDAIARNPIAEFPRAKWALQRKGVSVVPLQDEITRGVKPALRAVLGAVALVLIIACVNVVNLLLARGAQRRGEFAMRTAFGAGRGRIVRQLLTESAVLATLSGVLGIVVARFGVAALIALSPPGLPRIHAIGVDTSAFLFALGLTSLVGLGIGLIPAVQATRSDPQRGLQQSSRGTASGITRNSLVVVEVALALVLLVGSGLLLRSLQRLFRVDAGFDAGSLITMQVQTAGPKLSNASATLQFFAGALDAVQRVPGVQTAALTSQLPLSGKPDRYPVHFESAPTPATDFESMAFAYGVTADYLTTMRIPLRSGRRLDARDRRDAPIAVLLSESYAKRRFPGVSPIGQRLRVGSNDGPWMTIVGVVGDVRQASLALDQTDAVYIPSEQWRNARSGGTARAMSLVVRSTADPATLVPAIKSAIWSVDRDQPIMRVATMEGLLEASAAERRFVLVVFEAFALVALMLAAAGIYGVLSGSVTERTREIGIRTALGASRATILALVIRKGMVLTMLGVVIGIAGAVAASQAIVTLLFGVERVDALTYAGVVGLLVIVAGIACWIPASRAARVDPTVALRAD